MLSDLIKPENIVLQLESTDKDSLFAELTENLVRTNKNLDRYEILNSLFEREEKMNTCIMKGIAVPHAVCSNIESPLISLGLSIPGIDYEIAGTGSKNYSESLVHLVVMIIFEKGNADRHLRVLADCARVLRIPGFYKSVLNAKSEQEVCNKICEYEFEF